MFLETLLPDRQGEISHIFFAGSSQKAAVDASSLQHFLGLQACDVSVEPPAIGTHVHEVKIHPTNTVNVTAASARTHAHTHTHAHTQKIRLVTDNYKLICLY